MQIDNRVSRHVTRIWIEIVVVSFGENNHLIFNYEFVEDLKKLELYSKKCFFTFNAFSNLLVPKILFFNYRPEIDYLGISENFL